ncbi:MAG: hypothetical protein RBT62_11210 [Spirochaetia bacterium]|nr:hypothetical protein [Spirochaetia bacterium]
MSILVLALLLLWSTGLQAQSLGDDNYLVPVDHMWGLPAQGCALKAIYPTGYDPILGVIYNGYYVLNEFVQNNKIIVYTDDDVVIGKDAYCYASFYDIALDEPILMLAGGDTVIPISKCLYSPLSEDWLGLETEGYSYVYGGFERVYNYFQHSPADYSGMWGEGRPGLWNDGIESIKAWSAMTETVKGKVIHYDESRMRYPFYSWVDSGLNFNNASLFWAEGEAGPGIGGTIEVAFSRSSDHVMVLNGAVDLARLNLYKDNNRLRRVLIRGGDGTFAFEYTFEDFVGFHKITFPSETRSITITILDVYKGLKWDDTCISAIYLKQPPLRPRAEYEAAIESYVRLKGYDRLIMEYEKARGGMKKDL